MIDGAGPVRDVDVRLIGGFAVELAGKPVDVGGGRVRALFVALALVPGEPLTTAQLAERIWGDEPPANIGPSLHTLMTRLRRGIGADLISTGADGYRLRVDPEQVDVSRFERLLRTARGSADEYPNLMAALRLWRGRPFEGVRSDWLESVEAPRLVELHLTAVERWADLLTEQRPTPDPTPAHSTSTPAHSTSTPVHPGTAPAHHGPDPAYSEPDPAHPGPGAAHPDPTPAHPGPAPAHSGPASLHPGPASVHSGEYSEVLAELRRLVTAYPLRESLWARLLRVLAGAGRSAEALELYEEMRQRLAEELGVDPGTELQSIFAELLSGPEQPAAKPAVVPHQLPADLPGFAGRVDALNWLDRALHGSDGPTAIVAIDGTAGTGKSVLAVHWAHAVKSRFPDGQLFVNLRGYSAGGSIQPEAALELLLQGLGVDEIPSGLEARSALFRTLLEGRRFLLILDNARDTAQVRPLLPGSGAQVVVTSRNQLRGLVAREGARRLSLGPMSPEESVELLANAVPDRPHEVGQLRAFAELCGRLPLALAIGAERAGRAPDSDIGQVIEELTAAGDRLDTLEVSGDELSSVRAVLSWSYQALPPESARLFRLLGCYPGAGFSPAAAAAVAAVTDQQANRLLDQLVEANLLSQESAGRYQFHDLVRLYAAELATPDETEEALVRAMDWLTWTAQSARVVNGSAVRFDLLTEPLPGVRPVTFEGSKQAVAWLDQEKSAMESGVIAGAEAGLHRQAARLASELWFYLAQRQLPDPRSIRVHELAAASAARTDDALLEAVVVNQLAVGNGMADNLDQSNRQFLLALDRFDAVGNRLGVSMVHANLGINLRKLGDVDGSIRHQRLAVEAAADNQSLAAALNNLAAQLVELGRYEEAIRHGDSAVELNREAGNVRGEVDALDSTAMAYAQAGDPARSVTYAQEAVRLARDHQLGIVEVIALRTLAQGYEALGRPADARSTWSQALAAGDRYGPSPDIDRDEIVARLKTLETSTGT